MDLVRRFWNLVMNEAKSGRTNWPECPLEFDPGIYRLANRDLQNGSDAELLEHYQNFGAKEGRVSSKVFDRKTLIEQTAFGKVLEIGPFANPLLRGPNVKYFDIMNREQLQNRAIDLGLDPSSCPYINYVSPVGDLGVVNGTFQTVVSSHVIEHQPDLIAHLLNVETLLSKGGRYVLIIPDRRYCFDHFVAPTSIAQVLAAHAVSRKFHSLDKFLEHRLLLTHNDPARHWAGDSGEIDTGVISIKFSAAMEEWRKSDGSYIDVHAWQFDPDLFTSVIYNLNLLGIIKLKVGRIYRTIRNSIEFFAVLDT